MGVELYLADKRMGMTKLTVAFPNFIQALKNKPSFIGVLGAKVSEKTAASIFTTIYPVLKTTPKMEAA